MDPRTASGRARLRLHGGPIIAVALLVVCATAAPVAHGRDVPADPAAAGTPVFSARRVPALTQSLAATPGLADDLDAVVAAGPPDVCLQVSVAGRTLYATGSDRSLVPASNQKVLTADLVLRVLGPDHRFTTTVVGSLDRNGTVTGDLYLVGGGDPVLRTRAYDAYFGDDAGGATSIEELADAVVAAGVHRVTGSVVGDESRYDTLRGVPSWPDDRYLRQHQLGPLSALSLNQGFRSFPAEYSDEGLAELVPADDPATFAAATFGDLLAERGVQVDGPPRAGGAPTTAPTIAAVDSPPLADVVGQLLNRSDNQISELLVKEAGVLGGGGGTTADGLAVLWDALIAAGLPDTGVGIHDGSGLGYDNRLTCGLLATVLSEAGPGSDIDRGLAVAGETGTLRERFTDDAVRGRLRAKTGSLNEVTSLSGFASPDDAPEVVFSYIANGAVVGPELLGLQERLGETLVSHGRDVPLSALGPR